MVGAFNRNQLGHLRTLFEAKVSYGRSLRSPPTVPLGQGRRHRHHARRRLTTRLSAAASVHAQGKLDEAISKLDELDGVDGNIKLAVTQALKKEEVTVTADADNRRSSTTVAAPPK